MSRALATSWRRRLVRCALLRADSYEEVEADRDAMAQAFAVVALAAMSSVAGGWLETWTWNPGAAASLWGLVVELVARALEPIAFWLGGAAFAYMVGSSFFRGPETQTDYAEVLRTTGFAFAPGLLGFLVAIPPASVSFGAQWCVRVWTVLALIVAVRQALDFTTGRAVGTVLVGWALGWLVMWGAVSVSLQLAGIAGG